MNVASCSPARPVFGLAGKSLWHLETMCVCLYVFCMLECVSFVYVYTPHVHFHVPAHVRGCVRVPSRRAVRPLWRTFYAHVKAASTRNSVRGHVIHTCRLLVLLQSERERHVTPRPDSLVSYLSSGLSQAPPTWLQPSLGHTPSLPLVLCS